MNKNPNNKYFKIIVFIFIIGFTLSGFKSAEYKIEPLQTGEIATGIYAVNDKFVNMFVIRDGENYLVVDAGSDANNIKSELQKLKIEPDKVVAVLLTHTHHDHIAAINLFKNARIYLSDKETETKNGEKPKILTLGKDTYKNEFSFVTDQQIIHFKKTTVKALFTPGHTPGSTCYLVNDQYLFVGDAFSLNDDKKIDKPNKIYSKDMNAAIQSFGKINNLAHARYIFTAHTGYSGDYKNAIKTELK